MRRGHCYQFLDPSVEVNTCVTENILSDMTASPLLLAFSLVNEELCARLKLVCNYLASHISSCNKLQPSLMEGSSTSTTNFSFGLPVSGQIRCSNLTYNRETNEYRMFSEKLLKLTKIGATQ